MPLWPGCTHCSGWFLDLVFTRATVSLPAKKHSSQLASSLSWCLGLFLPRSRIWHFLLLNFMRSCKPISPASRGITGWWHDTMALAATPLSFVSPADFWGLVVPSTRAKWTSQKGLASMQGYSAIHLCPRGLHVTNSLLSPSLQPVFSPPHGPLSLSVVCRYRDRIKMIIGDTMAVSRDFLSQGR